MTELIDIGIVVGYLTGIGATFQLAETLNEQDSYGKTNRTFRWLASCVWPVTASIAAGIAVAKKIQERRTRPPRAIATERRRLG